MIKLDTSFSEKEKNVLHIWGGDKCEILSSVEGESYILNSSRGTYLYNECFAPTEKEFFARQKYEKVIPYRIVKFCQFYLMNIKEEKNIWYRGRQDNNGNWEYICYSDSLEEAFEGL